MQSPKAANEDQIAYWNSVSADRWVAAQERLDAMISPLGLRALEQAAPVSGAHVIDIGCGCGQTSLQLAEAVGHNGSVLGLDISRPMLARARGRAEAQGLSWARFEEADAQVHVFEARYDLVFSRFGVMFFEDFAAAFRNLRAGLIPGGRLVFVCWQALALNPWMADPMQAISPFIEVPPRANPQGPGPYALADQGRLRSLVQAAGFRDAQFLDARFALSLGRDVEEALSFVAGAVCPTATALAAASGEARESALSALREILARHLGPAGVTFDSAVWIVDARNP